MGWKQIFAHNVHKLFDQILQNYLQEVIEKPQHLPTCHHGETSSDGGAAVGTSEGSCCPATLLEIHFSWAA